MEASAVKRAIGLLLDLGERGLARDRPAGLGSKIQAQPAGAQGQEFHATASTRIRARNPWPAFCSISATSDKGLMIGSVITGANGGTT